MDAPMVHSHPYDSRIFPSQDSFNTTTTERASFPCTVHISRQDEACHVPGAHSSSPVTDPAAKGSHAWEYMSPPQPYHMSFVRGETLDEHSGMSQTSHGAPGRDWTSLQLPPDTNSWEAYANSCDPSFPTPRTSAHPRPHPHASHRSEADEGTYSVCDHALSSSACINDQGEPARMVFSTTASFLAAERRRSNPYKFFCQYCLRGFTAKHNYNHHIAAHNNEKPYACSCGSTFTTKSDLKRHQERSKKHTTVPLYMLPNDIDMLPSSSSSLTSSDSANVLYDTMMPPYRHLL